MAVLLVPEVRATSINESLDRLVARSCPLLESDPSLYEARRGCAWSPEPVGAAPPSGWVISAHTASRERSRTSAIAAMVGKAGVATRPDSIFLRVSGDTRA